MTRLGFFVFNVFFVVILYGNVYLNGSQPGAVSYAVREISEPYMALVLLMAILATVRWFMGHDEEVAREIVTWLNTFWLVPVLTVLALYLIGGIKGAFWQGLGSLMTLR